ncbi:hypothetical protein PV327_005798 [Microctonus hyperodae]|uniref:Uncharacterized protein n=1 Tax=Microctonus hyperodae TaxID=165561 RepID=A0AA39G2K5_MICHY|nr:hypothetical protein PV327_005798 [Microctonus hyperodae]
MTKKGECETLSLTLIEENGNKVILNWQKTEQLLVNKYMPLWIARYVQTVDAVHHELIENFIPENMGNLILYRDLAKSSAVVYTEYTNSIHGEIGEDYIIDSLPLKELNREHLIVGSQYIKRRRINIENYPSIEVTQDTPPERCISDQQNFDTDKKVTVLYPEILILITHEILKEAKKVDPIHYYVYLVQRYIVHFNTISMLFDKLSTESIKIHINIAGIIVEGEEAVFPFTRYYKINKRQNAINGKRTLLEFTPKYLRQSGFHEDLFDFFFISTILPLDEPVRKNGFSTRQHQIYQMRIADNRDQTQLKCLGSIVQYSEHYRASFSDATARIAWLMNVKNNMMSLQWDERNFKELQRYVSPNGCNRKLECKILLLPKEKSSNYVNPMLHSPAAPLPIDGTPCDFNKVLFAGIKNAAIFELKISH